MSANKTEINFFPYLQKVLWTALWSQEDRVNQQVLGEEKKQSHKITSRSNSHEGVRRRFSLNIAGRVDS